MSAVWCPSVAPVFMLQPGNKSQHVTQSPPPIPPPHQQNTESDRSVSRTQNLIVQFLCLTSATHFTPAAGWNQNQADPHGEGKEKSTIASVDSPLSDTCAVPTDCWILAQEAKTVVEAKGSRTLSAWEKKQIISQRSKLATCYFWLKVVQHLLKLAKE